MSPTSGPVGNGGDAACAGPAIAASRTATFQKCLLITATSRVR